MSSAPIVEPRLSQPARFVDAFVAPQKTFLDIRRSASWWLPWLFSALAGLLFTFGVQTKIGWNTVIQHQMAQNQRAQDQIDQLPKEQQEQRIEMGAKFARYISFSAPVIGLLAIAAIAGVLMLTVNFGLGANATYMQYWAVWVYAVLPESLRYLLAAALVFFGVGTDTFDVRDPVASNLGALCGPGTAAWLKALLSSFDLFTIWSVVLLILGISIVCKVSRGAATAVVCGWWVVIILFSVAAAALRG